MHSLELRILKHIRIMEDEKVSTSCLCVTWKLPPSDLIKLNVDVAMGHGIQYKCTTFISMMTQHYRGEVLKIKILD